MKKGWVIAIIGLACLIVAGIIFMSITRWGWAWTGMVKVVGPEQAYYRGRTLWDLMELLIVPAALALIAYWFSNRERKDDREAAENRADFDRVAADKRAELDREVAEKRAQTEREIATDRLQEAALQTYYDKMTELLLDKNLRGAEEGEEVISIARSRTLATLRSLDGNRKGMLIKFLCEVRLIDKERTIVNLNGANLYEANLNSAKLCNVNLSFAYMKDANLRFAELTGADLSNSDLRNARLDDANLREANLSKADLCEAVLENANMSRAVLDKAYMGKAYLVSTNLSGAELTWANLIEANLRFADLNEANLSKASLSKANLSKANLRGAVLREADLRRAKLIGTKELTNEQLATVKALNGAQMCDSRVYDPAIHIEIVNLRKEAGLDNGIAPPVRIPF